MTARLYLSGILRNERFRWTCALLALVSLLFPGYWTALRHPVAGTYHDDGIYVITAKALATGQGYNIISLPRPQPQTKYPPFYPWLLSLIWRCFPTFPTNLPAMVTLSFASLLAWLGAVYLLGREEKLSRAVLLFVVGIIAASTWVFGLGTMALSDTTFAALCTGSITLLRIEQNRTERSLRLLSAAAVLAALACLTRSAGLALPAAAIAWFFYKRQHQKALLFAGIVLVLMGPWIWYGITHSAHSEFAEAYYSSQSYKANSAVSFFSMPQKVAIACLNLLNFAFNSAHLLNLTGEPSPFIFAADLAIAVGFAIGVFRRFDLLVIFVFAYLGLLMLVCGGLGPRYTVPVFPLMLLIACRAVPAPRPVARVALSLFALLLLGHSVAVFYSARGRVAHGRKAWASRGDQDSEELFRMARWIEKNTDTKAILSANIDPFFYLYTGRQGIRSFNPDFYEMFYSPRAADRKPIGTPAHFCEELRVHNADYIVLTADKDYMEAPYLHSMVHRIASEEPSYLRLVYQGKTDDYQIYSVNRR